MGALRDQSPVGIQASPGVMVTVLLVMMVLTENSDSCGGGIHSAPTTAVPGSAQGFNWRGPVIIAVSQARRWRRRDVKSLPEESALSSRFRIKPDRVSCWS